MHIGLVIYGSLDTLSGGYLYDRKLVQHLREQGDTVTIVSQPWVNYGRHLLQNFSRGLRTELATQKFDVLLQDELNHPSLFWLNRSLRGRYPIISIVHHLRISEARQNWQNMLYRQVERHYLNSVSGFVFNSQTTRNTVFDLVGPAKPHIVALPAGDRFTTIAPRTPMSPDTSSTNPPLRLLFVGNLIPRKGLHIVLDALHLCRGQWQLDIIGSDSVDAAYAQRLRTQADQLGLRGRVQWLGRVSDDGLAEAFSQHDILIGPSSYEGYGISYLEAMGFGLPVIASTRGAACEIVTDGVDGFLVDPTDAPTLCARIEGLIQDRIRLSEMSAAARQRYLRHPTWGASMATIRTFLKSLIHPPTTPASSSAAAA